MRKWRFTKPRASAATTALLALLCAVAAHAAFLLFRYQTPAARQRQDASGIEMLNLAALPQKEQRDFTRWIALHDPARIARSSSRSGYSFYLPEPPPAGVEIHAYRNDLIHSVSSVSPFSPVPVAAAKFTSLPELAALPGPASASARKVRVIDQNGSPVTDPAFAFSPDPGAEKPSIIDIASYGRISGVTLRQSCGNSQLDKLALNAAAGMKTPGRTALIVIWPPAEVKK